MGKRPIPASLWWLIVLISLCVALSVVAGAVIYVQTQRQHSVRAAMITGGDVDRGRVAIERRACGSCHIIPAIDGALGKVGPDLTHIGQRSALAGSLGSDPGSLTAWIMHPQKLRPGSGMPDQGIDVREARDMAAYLYAQN